MEYFRSTGTSGGLIFTRTQSGYIKERCSELLRLVSEADRAVMDGSPDGPMRFTLVRDLVFAAVGASWAREHEDAPVVAALRTANVAAVANKGTAAEFDRMCSDVLRARFPEETTRPERNSRWG